MMRAKFFLLQILLFLFFPWSAFAAEQVNSFISDITLSADGSFAVSESIMYDFGPSERHGIFRYIPTVHPQKATTFWKERYADVDFQSATLDGRDVPFEITNAADEVKIKIGDPLHTLSGPHIYTIVYTVRGGYSFLNATTSEIYWNATGNGWEVPIVQALVRIHAPSNILGKNRFCYKGIVGSTQSCDSIETLSDGGSLFTAKALQNSEGLTIAQELNTAAVAHVVLERIKLLLLLALLVPALVLILLVIGYRYKTRYKTGNPIIAEYEPYKDFKPMYAGMLFDGRLDPQDITAGIVYLAQQGFLKISKIEKKVLFLFEVDDYQMVLQKPIADAQSIFLKKILRLLFSDLSSAGDTVTLSSLRADTAKQRQNALNLVDLRKELKKDMEKEGFYQLNNTALVILTAAGGILLFALFLAEPIAQFMPHVILIPSIALLICAFIAGAFMYERRTRLGYLALDHLKGFKLFLSVTDKERFEFHNAPEKSPEKFMEYLPYAIAFGVEKQWAKVYEGITIPNPGWYDGGSTAAFSAVNLTTSLGAFSSSFAVSSGSSASSGGGSSGGGGGGGGGGSW